MSPSCESSSPSQVGKKWCHHQRVTLIIWRGWICHDRDLARQRPAKGQPTRPGQSAGAEPRGSAQHRVTGDQQQWDQDPAGWHLGPAAWGGLAREEQRCFGAEQGHGTGKRVPRYLPALGGLLGPTARVCLSSPSVLALRDTPSLRLLRLAGWVGWKEGGKSHFEGRHLPSLQAGATQGRGGARCPGRAPQLLRASPGDRRPLLAELRTSRPAA